jgi:hypothetical protein
MHGAVLTFHLAGINNQNFIMRDEETGTYWQQISGRAISGPLAGAQLRRIASDELTLALWKSEEPRGTVLMDEAKFVPEYAPRDWDQKAKNYPTVLSYAQPGLKPRDLMFGVQRGGEARAYRSDAVLREKLIEDRVGTDPVMLVVGPDGESVRGFVRRLRDGRVPDFYRADPKSAGHPLMLDSLTGSEWNFQGCANGGTEKGACLERLQLTKDYWFDWRHYNPKTTVFGYKPR